MNIVHVVPTLCPSAGGLPVVPLRLAAAMREHDVTVLASEPHLQQTAAQSRFTVQEIDSDGATETVRRASIVHCHGVWDWKVSRMAAVARAAGHPVVVAPHGMLDPWSLRQSKWKKRLAMATTHRRYLQRAAALHVLNADEGRLLGPLGLSSPRWIIPNGVDLSEIDQSLAQTHGDPFPDLTDASGSRCLLFLGRLHYKKGVAELVNGFLAAELPRDWHLVIAGPDDGEGARLQRRVESLGEPGKRIHLIGAVHGTTKYALLHHAAAFVLSSFQEGFSVAVLEALACSTPVLITPACHFPQAIDCEAGWLCEPTPHSIAESLRVVVSSDAERLKRGAAGRDLIQSQFTWDKIATNLLRHYQEQTRFRLSP